MISQPRKEIISSTTEIRDFLSHLNAAGTDEQGKFPCLIVYNEPQKETYKVK